MMPCTHRPGRWLVHRGDGLCEFGIELNGMSTKWSDYCEIYLRYKYSPEGGGFFPSANVSLQWIIVDIKFPPGKVFIGGLSYSRTPATACSIDFVSDVGSQASQFIQCSATDAQDAALVQSLVKFSLTLGQWLVQRRLIRVPGRAGPVPGAQLINPTEFWRLTFLVCKIVNVSSYRTVLYRKCWIGRKVW